MARFAEQQHPQHFAGLSFVVLLHVLLIYAFLHGLASNRSATAPPPPLQLRMIPLEKPQQKELPPLKPTLKEAPKSEIFKPPVLDRWLPPEPPSAPVGIIEEPPQGPPVVAGNGGGAGRTPATDGTGPGKTRAAMSDCSNAQSLASTIVYPPRARRLGLQQGQVDVEFTVAAGGNLEIDGVTASNPVFASAALDAVRQLHCAAGRYRLPISFVLQD